MEAEIGNARTCVSVNITHLQKENLYIQLMNCESKSVLKKIRRESCVSHVLY